MLVFEWLIHCIDSIYCNACENETTHCNKVLYWSCDAMNIIETFIMKKTLEFERPSS